MRKILVGTQFGVLCLVFQSLFTIYSFFYACITVWKRWRNRKEAQNVSNIKTRTKNNRDWDRKSVCSNWPEWISLVQVERQHVGYIYTILILCKF